MNSAKAPIAFWISGLLCLLAILIFVSINVGTPAPRTAPTQVPAAAAQHESNANEGPMPNSSGLRLRSAPPVLGSAPASPHSSPRSSSAAPQDLAIRYAEVVQERDAANQALYKLLDADPEITGILKAKLQALDSALGWLVMAQALRDSQLRPVIMDYLGDEQHVMDARLLYKAAAAFGVERSSPTSGRRAEDLASLLLDLEPRFQADYQRLLAKVGVSDQLEHVYLTYKTNSALDNFVIGYMRKAGYSYNLDSRSFILKPK